VSYIPSRSLFRLRQLGDLPDLIRRAPHEEDFRAFAQFGVEAPVVVDVGANRGQSIRSFLLSLPHATIHAFEPNSTLARYLRTSTHAAHVHNVALGDTGSTMELLVPRYGHTEWDTRATLDRSVADAFLSEANFFAFRPDRTKVVGYTVDVRTLDSFALEPDIVKIDAEGVGAAVIRGAAETIRRHRPVLLVEDAAGPPAIEMAKIGYRPARYDPHDNSLHLDEVGDLNTFFVTSDHCNVLRPALIEP
jgi:FkbM family methyltransferase